MTEVKDTVNSAMIRTVTWGAGITITITLAIVSGMFAWHKEQPHHGAITRDEYEKDFDHIRSELREIKTDVKALLKTK